LTHSEHGPERAVNPPVCPSAYKGIVGALIFDPAQKYENAIKNDTGKKEPDSVLKTLSLEKNLVGLFN
jgi:hypothetical protein